MRDFLPPGVQRKQPAVRHSSGRAPVPYGSAPGQEAWTGGEAALGGPLRPALCSLGSAPSSEGAGRSAERSLSKPPSAEWAWLLAEAGPACVFLDVDSGI